MAFLTFAANLPHLVVAVIDGLFVGRISPDCEVSGLRFFNHLNGFTALEPLKATMAETDDGTEVETSLLAPAFKRLEALLIT